MCIDIVEICFGIARWQILSIFERVTCLRHDKGGVLLFHGFGCCCFFVVVVFSEKVKGIGCELSAEKIT